MDYADNSSSIEDDCYLEIDGGRYLAIDSVGNYYLSDRPQPIKGEKIPNEMSGVPVFQVDRDGDYFELVTYGFLAADSRRIWSGGDEILFNEILRKHDLESEGETVIQPVFLPPAVAKYPKMPQKEYVPTTYHQFTTKKPRAPDSRNQQVEEAPSTLCQANILPAEEIHSSLSNCDAGY